MATDVTPRTRPRNRRRLIVDAAGPIFSRRGYHGAGMEEIAGEVGITAAALYRHFPNKYALFSECAHQMVDELLTVFDEVPDDAPFEVLVRALADKTVAHRTTGGVYRWEARYLEADERRALRAKFAQVIAEFADAVERDSGTADARLRGTAALGTIASITVHQTTIAARRAEELLTETALHVARTDLAAEPPVPDPVALPALPEARSRRAQILAAAVPLFQVHGFSAVTISQIAAEVGVAPSAIYRHYPGKVDILTEACLQAAGLLQRAVTDALAATTTPLEAIEAVAATFVAYSFEQTALTSVAEAEIVGLPESMRRRLAQAQRDHLALWEERVLALRPELDARQARVVVHAGLGVVVETGRLLRWSASADEQRAISTLVLRALGVR